MAYQSSKKIAVAFSASSAPSGLTAYQNIDGKANLYWTLDPFPLDMAVLEWTVETSLDAGFSVIVQTFTDVTSGDTDFIDGCAHKGVVTTLPARTQGAEQTLYWRVRATDGAETTAFVSSTFIIPESIDDVVRQEMLDSITEVVYRKDFSTSGESNLSRLYKTFGPTFDEVNLERIFTKNDIDVSKVRDSVIVEKFGTLIGLNKPTAMKFIDYREVVRAVMAQAGNGLLVSAVEAVILSIYGVDPTIDLIRETLNTFVDDPFSTPVVEDTHVFDATLDEPVVWSDAFLAFGTIIDINNPASCVVTEDFVETAARKVIPAFAPVIFTGI